MLALSPLSSRAHKSRSCERNRQDHRTPRPISRKRLMLLPVRSSLAVTRNMHERGSFRCSIIEESARPIFVRPAGDISLFVGCLVPSFHRRRSMTSCAKKIPCSGLWDMWLIGTSRHEATDDAMFTLLLKATLAETAASIVDLRTNVDGWGKAPCRASTILRLADGDLTSKPAETARSGRVQVLCASL